MFSNARRVLTKCNTLLRLLYLLNIFNNYSLTPNGSESIAHEAEGHEGERNNCTIQQVDQKISRQNFFRQLKRDFNPFLPPKQYNYGLRFSLLASGL